MYTFDRKKFIMLRIITQILPLLRVLKRQIYLKFVMLVLVLQILDYTDIATKKHIEITDQHTDIATTHWSKNPRIWGGWLR